MLRLQRLEREVAKITESPPMGINLCQKDDNFNILEAVILGPVDTPYENGYYELEIVVPENYPFSPPLIKFITKIYHPNIDDSGRICLDLTKMPPKGNWRPTIGLEGLLIAVRMLMQQPNPDDPLMAEIADEYLNNRKEFDAKAKEYTQKYANGD